MFQLSKAEWKILRTQFASSSWGGSRYQPFAFTELGVAMLSSVLGSEKAIAVNIDIMRAFVAVRRHIILQAKPTQSIEERIKALEKANEELLKDMNDLSEDTQKYKKII